jgi:hypothetical protein
MPITQRTYRERKGTAILAVALYAPLRKQQRTSAHVDQQHKRIAEQANAEQVNDAYKFDSL